MPKPTHVHNPRDIFTPEQLKAHVKVCDNIHWLRTQVNIRLSENLRLIETTVTRKRLQAIFDASAIQGHPANGPAALHNQLRQLLEGSP